MCCSSLRWNIGWTVERFFARVFNEKQLSTPHVRLIDGRHRQKFFSFHQDVIGRTLCENSNAQKGFFVSSLIVIRGSVVWVIVQWIPSMLVSHVPPPAGSARGPVTRRVSWRLGLMNVCESSDGVKDFLLQTETVLGINQSCGVWTVQSLYFNFRYSLWLFVRLFDIYSSWARLCERRLALRYLSGVWCVFIMFSKIGSVFSSWGNWPSRQMKWLCAFSFTFHYTFNNSDNL